MTKILCLLCATLLTGQTAQASSDLSAADREFIVQAARDELVEVGLAQVGKRQSSDNRVVSFAERIFSEHTEINNELKALAKGRAVRLPVSTGPSGTREIERLMKLGGKTFEHEYLRDVVEEQRRLLRLFELESSASRDPELKRLAGYFVPMLGENLESAKALEGATRTRSRSH